MIFCAFCVSFFHFRLELNMIPHGPCVLDVLYHSEIYIFLILSCVSDQRLANARAHNSRFVSANLPCNKFKNRLVNIMPYESTRVSLQPIRGVEGSDYVNASFIDGYRYELISYNHHEQDKISSQDESLFRIRPPLVTKSVFSMPFSPSLP